jgi:uncharacterized protein (DUF2132 family)
MRLYFLFADPLSVTHSIQEQERVYQDIYHHLQLDPPDRYPITLFPHPEESDAYYVFVDDLATCDRLTDVSQLPLCVSKDHRRRTVWINPPSIDEKLGNERSTPWNTHYTEYFQLYIADSLPRESIHTIKYWKRFCDLEMYHPSPLAVARYHHLKSLQTATETETETATATETETATETKEEKEIT